VIAALVAAGALVLGASSPADPTAEATLRGAQAYVAYVNAHGGVRGRQVEIAIDAADALASLDELPHYALPPRAEGEAYGRWLAAELPDAKVAVLVQADATGRALLAGLRRAAARQVVAVEQADVDVATPLAALQQTGADVLCLFAPALSADAYGSLAQLRWKPQVVAATSVAYPPAGTVSATYLRGDDPLAAKLAKGADARDPAFLQGLANGWTAVDVLRRAGPNPTAAAIRRTAAALVEAGNPFLLSGVKVRAMQTTAQLQLARWRGGRFVPFGGLVAARA
jgi:branched-chain amino acid transport system substrate-binding protein